MKDLPLRVDGRGVRWHLAAGAALVGLALGLSGCGIVQPAATAPPSPSPTGSAATVLPTSPATSAPSTPPTESAAPTSTPTTAAPTTTPGAVTAKGSLLTYTNLVSDQLAGTCSTTKGAPTIALSDAANDFYGTVDVTAVLKAGRDGVASIRGDFGEDFEGTARRLVYPDTGATATVSANGSAYTLTGKLLMYEGSSKKGSLVPFTLTVECAGDTW